MEKRTITNILYIAFDGKQFNTETECVRYEYEKKLDDFLNSKNTWYFEDLEGCPYPTDEGFDTEDWCYYYVKILNEAGLKEFYDFIKFLPTNIDSYYYSDPKIGQIICIMEPTFDHAETIITSLDNITNDIKYFYEKLGFKMAVEEMK